MRNVTAKLACLVVAGGLLATAGCSGGEKGAQQAATSVVTGVTMATVAAVTIPDRLEAVGTVRARNSSLIAARIPATVGAVLVREGDRVGKGKLLMTLMSAETVAGAAGAEARVEEAQRGVAEAKARKELADVTFGRYQKMFQEQAVSRQEYDGRRAERDVANQALARAEAALVQAREGAKAAATMAGYTRVTAPIGGIVTAKQVDVGATVFPGTPLMTVEEEGSYRLEANAPESLLGKVRPGQEVAVVFDGVSGETKGRVADVVPTVDPASRTFVVKVDVAAKGLRSGLYGKAFFPVGSRQGVVVPKGAIVDRGALTSVWVVDGEKRARLRLIKTGPAVGDRVEVLSGLSAGERIVTGGMEKVVDGAKVE